MIYLVRFWQPILAVILTGFLAYGLHSFSMTRAEKTKNEAVEAQRIQTETQCIKQQKVTSDASQTYQTGLNNLNGDLASVMQQQSCIKLSTGSTSNGRDATNQQSKSGYRDEVTTNELYRFAGQCEQDRLKVITLQQFINQERE